MRYITVLRFRPIKNQLLICFLVYYILYNNNNEYLERLTHTGPKRLHILYKYILSEFNAYNMNAHRLTHAHTQTHIYIYDIADHNC